MIYTVNPAPFPVSNTQIFEAQRGSHAAVKKKKNTTLGKQPSRQSIRRVKLGT